MLFHTLIAPVNMINSFHLAFPFRRHCRQNDCRASPKIGAAQRCSMKGTSAIDYRHAPLN